MYRISRHKSGLTVATAEMPHMTSVSLGIWVGVGGRFEPAPLNGAAHFIEHMLFKGTRRRSAREISQAVEGIGGYLNAFTSEETTCFYSKARADRLDELLDVLTDMFLNSRFEPSDVDKERGVIKEELAMYLDQPQHLVHEVLNEAVWPDQPLGRPLTGTTATLDGLRRPELVAFQKSNYVSGGTLVAAAGNVQHSKLLKAVARIAGRFPQGRRPSFTPARSDQTAPGLRLVTKETEQTQLAMAIRTCSRHDDRRFALRLLHTILGENMSSRLFQVIREDRGLAYSIYSSPCFFDDVGTLTIAAGLDTANLPKVVELIVKELRSLASKAPSAGEMRRARDYVIGQIDLASENTESQMMWLGEQYLGSGRVLRQDEVKQRLSEVTPAKIRAAARDFFRPDRLTTALVSPLKSTDGLAKLLAI